MIGTEDARPAGGLHAAHADVVFDGNWNSQCRKRGRLLRVDFPVDLIRAIQRALSIDFKEGVQGLVQLLGGVQRRFGRSPRASLTASDAISQVSKCRFGGHKSSSGRGSEFPRESDHPFTLLVSLLHQHAPTVTPVFQSFFWCTPREDQNTGCDDPRASHALPTVNTNTASSGQ